MSKYLRIKACLCYIATIIISRFPKKSGSILKTSLGHLSRIQQGELHIVTKIITQKIKPEMIILFGSFTGEPTAQHIYYEYQNIFHLLVITEKDIPESTPRWEKMEMSLEKFNDLPPVSLVSHNIHFVNEKIVSGNYFFSDVLRQGIMLYDSGKFQLVKPKKLSPKENKTKAREYFDHWFHSANEYFISFQSNLEKGSLKLAAFELHQVVERFYTCALLVHTGCRPKTHNIDKLSLMCTFFSRELYTVFPRSNAKEKGLFRLLEKAYIDARYKKTYSINREQLEELAFSINRLKILTEIICKEKIEGFGV